MRRVLGRRQRDERGAVAVEAAIFLPLLALLIFGMIDMSFAVRDYAGVSALSRAGVRVAASQADAGPAEASRCGSEAGLPVCAPANVPKIAQMAADAIQNSGTAVPSSSIRYILVYKANANGMPGTLGAGAAMPSTCPPDCVKFVWQPTKAEFRYDSGTWRSTTISACFPSAVDRVGVYVNSDYSWLSGVIPAFLGASRTLNMGDRTMMNFEPLPTGSCNGNGVASGGHL